MPTFRGTRDTLAFDVENFANLIDSSWGQLRQVSFPYVAPVVEVARIATAVCPNAAASCYVYDLRSGQTGPVAPFNTVVTLPSLWRLQLGFRIAF